MPSPSNADFAKQDDNQLTVRTRRSKGKSKGGCAGCKTRKVKCDETRPICSRCKTNDRACVYDTKKLPKWKKEFGILVFSPKSKTSSPPSPKLHVVGLDSQSPRSGSSSFKTLNMFEQFGLAGVKIKMFEDCRIPQYQPSTMSTEDLSSFRSEDFRLLTHFMSKTSCGLVGSQQLWIDQTLRLAFQNNFLMHAMLALSARHLQHLQGAYDLEAIESHHHQQALANYQKAFRGNTIRINQDAVLGTSLLLCFYSSSLLDFEPSSNISVTDTCLTFYPGIRSIVSDAPSIAHNGLFRSIVTPPLFLRNLYPSIGPGAKLLNLLNTLPATPILIAKKDLYIERIESLTLYMSTSTMQGLETGAIHELILCFLRWQSFCPPEFIALVRAFDSVAIIILAHFYAAGGFAHSRSGNIFWWWEQKPVYMVRTITKHLGPQWSLWMEWPNSMIARYGEGKVLKLTAKDTYKPWSSAIDPIDASFFPDLYNWERLIAYTQGPSL